MAHLHGMEPKETQFLNPTFSMLNGFMRQCKRYVLDRYRQGKRLDWNNAKTAEHRLLFTVNALERVKELAAAGELVRAKQELVKVAIGAAVLHNLCTTNDAHLHKAMRVELCTTPGPPELSVVSSPGKEEQTALPKCGVCGAPRSAQTTYCPNCGDKL